MSPEQMEVYRQSQRIEPGQEYDPFAGLDVAEDELRRFLDRVPFAARSGRRYEPPRVAVPEALAVPQGSRMSTQEGFGRILSDLARDPGGFADRIVTTSPDVTVSTNLGSWVNRRGLFDRRPRADLFREEAVARPRSGRCRRPASTSSWASPRTTCSCSWPRWGWPGPLFGARLLPIGTLYDPFICRGLDALNYACYQGAKFLLVATPSGVSLAPEGGAHQSVITPLIGIGQPGLTAFEPAFVDELAAILTWALGHIQDDDGGSVYLRLSTRPIDQPKRAMTPELRARRRAGRILARASRARRRRWRSSARASSPPRPSRRMPRSARTSPTRGCSWSPRPAGCTPTGWPPPARGPPATPRPGRTSSRCSPHSPPARPW